MATLPELLPEDVQEIQAALRDLLAKTEATLALIMAEGGFLVVHEGDAARVDVTTLGALASNAFNATQAIARVIEEPDFTHIYQQGEAISMLVSQIDSYNAMVVLFPAQVSVGAVKYYAGPTVERIAHRFDVAQKRPSNHGLDLALLNLPDSEEIFRRKTG